LSDDTHDCLIVEIKESVAAVDLATASRLRNRRVAQVISMYIDRYIDSLIDR